MKYTFLAASLLLAFPAYAQSDDDDEPMRYDDARDDDDTDDELPAKRKKKRSRDLRDEDEEEGEREKVKSLASLDDPNVGLGGDIILGLALPESSRAGVNPRFLFGVRFTWEWGRLLADEFLREMFFLDVMYSYVGSKEGTALVNTDTNFHNLTLAPALALPFGKSPVAFYAQVGLGLNIADTNTVVGDEVLKLSGTKFLFQYGAGLRFRPAVVADGSVRLQFRIEVSRFIRGYMHDMYFAGGAGLIF